MRAARDRFGSDGLRRRRFALLVGAAVVVLGTLAPSPASAAAGTLQGTVTSAATGQPLAGVEVRAYSASWAVLYGTTTTSAWGTFSMSLPAGTYIIRYDNPTGAHQRVYSGGSPTWIGSSPVNVPSGGSLDASMATLMSMPVRSRIA